MTGDDLFKRWTNRNAFRAYRKLRKLGKSNEEISLLIRRPVELIEAWNKLEEDEVVQLRW